MEKKSVSVKDGDKEIKLTGFSVEEVEKILKSAEMTEGGTEKRTGVEIKETGR